MTNLPPETQNKLRLDALNFSYSGDIEAVAYILNAAKEQIDQLFHPGYAEANPELLSGFMQSAIRMNTHIGAGTIEDAANKIVEGLYVLSESIKEPNKAQRRDSLIEELEVELQKARQASVTSMLGQLRLREAVLLYVGHDANNFIQQITETFGVEIASAVEVSLFTLDNAPVSSDVKEALRVACHGGMHRW